MSIGERGLMKPDTHKVEVGEIKVKLERKEPILKQWLNRKKMKRRMSERMSWRSGHYQKKLVAKTFG